MMIAKCGLLLLLFAPLGIDAAQQEQTGTQPQGDSLVAAARRAKDQKKDQAKPTRVWDNDNLPKNPDELSVVGPAPAAADVSPALPNAPEAANAPGAAKKPDPTAKNTQVQADLAAAKDQLQTLQTEADILQRKLALDKQTYYGKPDYASDKAGEDSLKDEQDQVDAKQAGIAAAQKKIADLQAQLNPAGGTATAPPR
jgi:hypothetical protein